MQIIQIMFTICILSYIIFKISKGNSNISVRNELVIFFLRIFKPKYFLIRIFKNPPRLNGPLRVSKNFSSKYDVKYHNIEGIELMTAGSHGQAETQKHLIYFHGGAYVLGKNGVKGNETFISNLIDFTDTKVTFIDYPVAPESKYTHTLEKVCEAYNFLVQNYPDDEFVLVGDSAGGGLALSLAQIISKNNALKNPEKIALFSPWLDLSLDNPIIDEQAKRDMILSKDALLYAARKYAEPSDFKKPHVSPIYGEFNELGDILMFFSSDELFYPDGLKMQQIAQSNNLNIKFRFYDNLPHDWVIFPIPEAKEALYCASQFIMDKNINDFPKKC